MVTYNEEDRIRDALESIRDAGEIVVVDAYSEDRTVDIADEYTDRVYRERWKGFSGQKNSAIGKATREWVLLLDADERVSEGLKEEIMEVVNNSRHDGFMIPRKSFFLGKWISHSGWWPDYTLRLFRNGRGFIESRKVHERVEVKGSVGRLGSPLIHYTYESIEQFVRKMDIYSSLAAEDMREQGRRFSCLRMLAAPPFTFLKMYLFRLGVMDGLHGLVLAILYSYYSFLKYAKLWEDECISE